MLHVANVTGVTLGDRYTLTLTGSNSTLRSNQLQIAGLIGTQPMSSSAFLNVKLLWYVQADVSAMLLIHTGV